MSIQLSQKEIYEACEQNFLEALIHKGYQPWYGGTPPYAIGTLVDVVYRDMERAYRVPIGITVHDRPSANRWTLYSHECPDDIIAYRLAVEESATGVKHDSGKPRFSLLPIAQVLQVVEVLEFGAKKYASDNWKKVDNQREHYFNAAQRHLLAWWQGEKKDPETGLSHLAHVVCCVLFLMWGDDNEKLDNPNND